MMPAPVYCVFRRMQSPMNSISRASGLRSLQIRPLATARDPPRKDGHACLRCAASWLIWPPFFISGFKLRPIPKRRSIHLWLWRMHFIFYTWGCNWPLLEALCFEILRIFARKPAVSGYRPSFAFSYGTPGLNAGLAEAYLLE